MHDVMHKYRKSVTLNDLGLWDVCLAYSIAQSRLTLQMSNRIHSLMFVHYCTWYTC